MTPWDDSGGPPGKGSVNNNDGVKKDEGIGLPTLQLPKGGGAISGIGEKFSVNAVTGTGSTAVPIYTSPGRSGFSPTLSLSYNSGFGNGPFGLGWQLSLPSITRKTDKGLPVYDDARESDVFLLSDAEDLVPALTLQNGQWQAVTGPETTPDGANYTVKRYRPRTEGLFARIERWQRTIDGDIHWRAITKDNVTHIYGQTPGARIADPADASRCFKWMLETTFDDKGQVMSYVYIPEDKVGMEADSANEQNRVNGNAPFVNTYLKRILYGNQVPYVIGEDLSKRGDWLMEMVFDYGDHDPVMPQPAPTPGRLWVTRADPFSSFRSSFEIRTYRLCKRALLFHHFPSPSKGLSGYDGLVRSTDFSYDQEDPLSIRMGNRIATRLLSVTQTGYVLSPDGTAYTTSSFPPVQFGYSKAVIDQTVYTVDPESLANAPSGLDGAGYQWIDLDGEGSAGLLYQTAGGLYFKRNSSPANTTLDNGIERAMPRFGAQELIRSQPGAVLNGASQFMDLEGDGHQDIVTLQGDRSGFYRRAQTDGWDGFRAFDHFPNLDAKDPNLRFMDVDGDGLTDILVSEDEVLSWHRSLGKYGFGEREYARKPFDEETGPALVFADPTQCIFLADMTGDGLTDLVRIRNGEVCYWPNRGYGRFGAKVAMDNAPCFEGIDAFDQRRLRLADIDGSGTTDILYIRHDGVAFYFNQSGNAWADEQVLGAVPAVDSLESISVTDLLGNGLACLVWSSPFPSDAGSPMHYIDLMGGQKPYLLTSLNNNLGSETRIRYVSSTKYYVQDRDAGTPWVTRLAFPVYVVERLEVFDYIGRTRLVTTYRYRHGYFDGVEREFRGFGYVEQRDAESFGDSASLFTEDTDQEADALHAPAVITKTWFHTGAWPDDAAILLHMAADYFVPAGVANAPLLPDTVLPVDLFLSDGSRLAAALTGEETREAIRAFKGSILRQEIYAEDASDKAGLPYTVSERNYTVEWLQPRGINRYAVFFTHARETIDYSYERNVKDPRIAHSIVLGVDPFGDILQSVSAGYGRNLTQAGLGQAPATPPGLAPDLTVDPTLFVQPEQLKPWFTLQESSYTPAIDTTGAYRGPMPMEVFRYELTRPPRPDESVPYAFGEIQGVAAAAMAITLETEPDLSKTQKRLFGDTRTFYLKNDLTPLPFGQNDSLGLVYETYQLTFTPGLALQVLVTGNTNPNKPADATALQLLLSGEGAYVNGPADANWWSPSGRNLFSPVPPNPPNPFIEDPGYAARHFFQPQAHRDPFGQYTRLTYDLFDWLPQQTQDPLGNIATAQYDYRVLKPRAIQDPNDNQTTIAFDALGLVSGTAIEGKIGAGGTTQSGDTLTGFNAHLPQSDIDGFIDAPNPLTLVPGLLGTATTRMIYNLQRFYDTATAHPADPTLWEPIFAATLVRETHTADLPQGSSTKVQANFSYSDGRGREVQKKRQTEAGPLDLSDPASPYTDPRWIGSGWLISNNKAKPIRQYEPFFSQTHRFEFAVKTGVTSTLFYDPLQRVIATLRPDHSWEKVVFDSWLQKTWDANDTVQFNPETDPDVGVLFSRLPGADYLPTWYGLRTDPAAAAVAWLDPAMLKSQQDAAGKTAVHNDTPTALCVDALAREFLTVTHNRWKAGAGAIDQFCALRKQLDIAGNQVTLTDALGRLLSRSDYTLLQTSVQQASMEAGTRWSLSNTAGKPIRLWDSRGYVRITGYDALQRPISLRVTGNGLTDVLAEKTVYGDSTAGAPPNPELTNLRTKAYQSFDAAGIVTSEGYDFKGNLIRSNRQLLKGNTYRATIDWNQNPALDEIFTGSTRYDALNRVIQQITPYSNLAGTSINILQPAYNEANLPEKVDAWLQQVAEPPGMLDTGSASLHAVTNIDYDAKGQRTRIAYGMGAADQASQVSTTYQRDPETFRLINLTTTRQSDGVLLQDLQYYYDPVGNITHVQDGADIQNVVYFRNKRVDPGADYVYDAVYRLIGATGREHLGQNAPVPTSYNDWPNINLPHPGDGNAMGTYAEHFIYDAVGNMQQIRHLGSDPSNPGWTRTFTYAAVSLLEPTRPNNRLTATTVGGVTETYSTGGNGYDPHGNMLDLPQLQIMQWDFKDRLQMTQRQRVSSDDADGAPHQGERTYYVYNADGLRLQKVTESSRGAVIKQRIYLGSSEVYREYDNTGSISLERDTWHVMDGKERVALIETRALGDDGTPAQLIRYQFGNHLGSACLELDAAGRVISYEEYYAFGSSAYQAVDQTVKVAAKRYRYTGKERDEETGLYYHDARYYACWLSRWLATDPKGFVDGPNLYTYVRNNPIRLADPTGTDGKTPINVSTENTGVANPAFVLDNPVGTQYSEFTLGQGVNGWWTPPGGSTLLQYHYRRRVGEHWEIGLLGGGGGSYPWNHKDHLNLSQGTGNFVFTTHVGTAQTDDLSQSGVGLYTQTGFLFGQSPDDDKKAANPFGQFLLAGSHAWRKKGEDGDIKNVFQLDANFIGFGSRFGSLNGRKTSGAFSALGALNLGFGEHFALEFGAGIIGAGSRILRDDRTKYAAASHLVRPLAAHTYLGAAFSTAAGKNAQFTVEAIVSKDFAPTVVDDDQGNTKGPLTFGLFFGYTGANHPKHPQDEQDELQDLIDSRR